MTPSEKIHAFSEVAQALPEGVFPQILRENFIKGAQPVLENAFVISVVAAVAGAISPVAPSIGVAAIALVTARQTLTNLRTLNDDVLKAERVAIANDMRQNPPTADFSSALLTTTHENDSGKRTAFGTAATVALLALPTIVAVASGARDQVAYETVGSVDPSFVTDVLSDLDKYVAPNIQHRLINDEYQLTLTESMGQAVPSWNNMLIRDPSGVYQLMNQRTVALRDGKIIIAEHSLNSDIKLPDNFVFHAQDSNGEFISSDPVLQDFF
jgi:hypothetical protein